jgi:uncharacterized repeat protein (TIGR01451 family)
MESTPHNVNLSPGAPWFLKRFYVDGHEYNTVAINTCGVSSLQYITLRSPAPKVDVTIEQHSVRLERYDPQESLALPPPFNYEHTILEDIKQLDDGLEPCPLLPGPDAPLPIAIRPHVLYMGGPVGPMPPVLSDGDSLPYEGRDPTHAVGPYNDYLASHWFYVYEDVNPGFAGQLREKYGALNTGEECPVPDGMPDAFFYNEQVLTSPYSFTEFFLPDLDDPEDPGTGEPLCNADGYNVTSAFADSDMRWRLWRMPDGPVPPQVPPPPPDLVADFSGFDPESGEYGAIRRATFEYDPDVSDKLIADGSGVRVYGGFPECEALEECVGAGSRPAVLFGAGDTSVLTDTAGYPVEVLPYTDPFAPFNPQHPDAPRSDSLTFNPAFMSEFDNYGEDLSSLYQRLSNNAANALEKVYHRLWYQPDYITKIRYGDDCDRDLSFPAVVQEFTYTMLDTTVNPLAVRPGSSQIAFPMATGADELPLPGTYPPDGGIGYGLTSFDADYNGVDDVVTVHTERTLNQHFEVTWQSARPSIPGYNPPYVPGPVLDLDGDGVIDDMDEDCTALNGNEMVVFDVQGVTLSADDALPFSDTAMFLDYLVQVTNVTPGQSVDLRVYYTGGGANEATPQPVGIGQISLDIGSAAVVDYLQGSITVVEPGEDNLGQTDGAWFVFVEDVSTSGELAVLTLGRALGATHSAIDDGEGNHDLEPGDPWYLKRFYVDGHEYNVVALMTQTAAGADPLDPDVCNTDLAFITIRTPVPKGNYVNPQDSLFQQGYFLDGLPSTMSVMPPFNVDHTVAVDLESIEMRDFNDVDAFAPCVGETAPAGPLTEEIVAEEGEPRLGTELRETYARPTDDFTQVGWYTHQTLGTSDTFTEIAVPEGQKYLLTMSWRSPSNRLAFYGCTRQDPGPFSELDPPAISHEDLIQITECWRDGIIPDEVDDGTPPYVGPPNGGDYDDLPGDLTIGPPNPDIRGPSADLSLEKTVSNTTPDAGTEVTYDIEVFNAGPATAGELVVTDSLPEGLEYVEDTSGGACVVTASSPDELTCRFYDLAADDSILFTVRAQVDAAVLPGTMLVNSASVELVSVGTESMQPSGMQALAAEAEADGRSGVDAGPAAPGLLTVSAVLDPEPDNNADEATVFVGVAADLGLQAASAGSVIAGEQLVLDLTLDNGGPSYARGVEVSLDLPQGTTYADSSGAACSGVEQGQRGVLVCVIDTVPSGGEAALHITLGIDSSYDPDADLELSLRASAPEHDDADPANNVAGASVDVVAESDLSVTLGGPATAYPGQPFEWVVTVSNAGPSDARDVVVTETLPPGVTLQDASGGVCQQQGDGRLRCEVGTVPALTRHTLVLRMQIDDAVAEGATLDLTAVASSATTERNASDNAQTGGTVLVRRVADLSLAKSALGEAVAGGRLEYRLDVANSGPASAVGVVVSDQLPEGVTFVEATAGATGQCDAPAAGGDLVVCRLPSVAPGETVPVSVVVQLDAGLADGAVLVNTASLQAASLDPAAGNDTASATVDVVRRADLRIEKSIAPKAVVAGETLAYVIEVANDGPSTASGVVVRDELPQGVAYASDTGGCLLSGEGELTCELGELVSGSDPRRFEVSVVVDADLADGTALRNVAEVSADTRDDEQSNNSAAVTADVEAWADLRLTKRASASTQVAGTTFDYVLRVVNEGPSVARDTVITDALPQGLELVSASDGCASLSDGAVRCEIGSLAVGEAAEVTLEVSIDPTWPDGSRIENTARAQSSVGDPAPDAAEATASVDIVARADLQLTKSGSERVEPGLALVYRLEVVNNGPSEVVGVSIEDTLPAGVSFESADGAACSEGASGQLSCEVGDLAVGEAAQLTVAVRVDDDLPDGAELQNTAVVQAETLDEAQGNNRDSVTTVVRLRDESDLVTGIVAEPDSPAGGTELLYRVSVANNGPKAVPGVDVTVSLPEGLTYAGGDARCEASAEGASCVLGEIPAGAADEIELLTSVRADLAEGTVLTTGVTAVGQRTDPDLDDNSAEVSVTVTRKADLAIDLAASTAEPVAGESLTYVVTVSSDGPSDTGPAEVRFTLPSNLSYESDTAGCDTAGLPVLRCPVPELAMGEAAQFDVAARLEADVAEGALVVVTAEVAASAQDPVLDDNETVISLEASTAADLVVSKTASVSELAPGEDVVYTLRVQNRGPSVAREVELVDTLPAGLTYVGDSAGCDASNPQSISCSVGVLGVGDVTEVELTARVDDDVAATAALENAAVASMTTHERQQADNSASASVAVSAVVDLALAVDVAGEVVTFGDPPGVAVTSGAVTAGRSLTLTVAASNAGPSGATEAVVDLTLPSELEYASDSGGCDVSAWPDVRCPLAPLAKNGQSSFQVVMRVPGHIADGLLLPGEASLAAAEPDLDEGDNTEEFAVRIGAAADLALEASVEPSRILVGESSSVTFQVRNEGPSVARSVAIEVTLPDGLEPAAGGASVCEPKAEPGRVDCAVGDLARGETRDVTLEVQAHQDLESGSLELAAAVVADSVDPSQANDTAGAVIEVSEAVDLEVVLTSVGETITRGTPPTVKLVRDAVTAGRVLTYSVEVSNSGPSAAEGAIATLRLPEGVTPVSTDARCSVAAVPSVVCALESLPSGASMHLEVGVLVDASLPSGTGLSAWAEVTTASLDTDGSNDQASAQTVTDARADLGIAVEVWPPAVNAGDQVSFRIATGNAGPSTAVGAFVRVSLPGGFAVVSGDERCLREGWSSRLLRCELGTMAPGEVAQLTLLVSLSESVAGHVEAGRFAVGATSDDPDGSNNSVGAWLEVTKVIIPPRHEPTPTPPPVEPEPGLTEPTPTPEPELVPARPTIFLPYVGKHDVG